MVAVVGTLLALLVFFALFGVFLTQYVPLWMTQNEAALSNQVQTSLATLKSGVDDQYLFGTISSYSVPFTTSSNSVPLIAQPTVASLSYLNGCPSGLSSTGAPESVSTCDFDGLSYATATGGANSKDFSYTDSAVTDYFEVADPNRYYTSVDYFFESDGIAGTQYSGHQWMVVPPPLNITKSGSTVDVQSSFVLLLGNASSFTGLGSKDVTSRLESASSVNSTDRFETTTGAPRTFNVTVKLGLHLACAWYNLLYNLSEQALGAPSTTTWGLTMDNSTGAVASATTSASTTFPSSAVCLISLTSTYELTLTIYGVSYASAYLAEVDLGFNAGGL